MTVRSTGTTLIAAGVATAVVVNLAAAALLLLAFRDIGSTAFDDAGPGGYVGGGSLIAAAFVLEAIATAFGGMAGAAATVRLRRHVLATVLALDPDRTREMGAGDALAIGVDLDLVGAFLVTTAPAAVLGVAEVLAGAYALSRGPAPGPTLTTLVVAAAAMVVLTGALLRRRRAWGRERQAITQRLVERLTGHRTVSLQDDRTAAADEGAVRGARYKRASVRLDHVQAAITGVPLTATLVIVGLLIVGSGHPPVVVATGLAGALIVNGGLSLLGLSTTDASAARDALVGLRRLDRQSVKSAPVATGGTGVGEVLLTGVDLQAAYPTGGGLTNPVTLTVRAGDRLLVTGVSGSGKTTLGELLSGRRVPTGGAIRYAPGVTVARVPQAGDDHVFHASLLFNVLCARRWPPEPDDERAAAALLGELGLRDLVDRMPAGLGQPVGDGGWRLSSGERARIALARALITRPDVVVLDETTAALDASTRDLVLDVARRHSRALICIAHP